MKKNKTVIQKCGGKSSGCTVEFELPYGQTKHKVTDAAPGQNQAGSVKTQPSK